MDLFVMNRFDPNVTRNEGDQVIDAAAEKEARILAKLNAKKKKKRLHEETVASIEARSETEILPESDGAKPSTVDEVETVEQIVTESVVEKPPRKKKKKNKGLVENENVTPPLEEQTLNETEDKTIEKEAVADEVIKESEGPREEEEGEEDGAGFTIMEEVQSKKTAKISRILPSWLAKPSIISCDLSSNSVPCKDFQGLHKFIQDALRRNKIKHFFPVQQQVIPFLLQNHNSLCRPNDICVSAPTGSGKTLAFVLPTVQMLSRETVLRMRCLVVLPVHDLAVQVYRVYANYCTGTKLHVALISGQMSFAEEQKLLVRQSRISGQYLSRADIVVCTPGRLVDHLQRTPGFSLASLRYLIIDEADRIMDEAPNDWLYHFEKAIQGASTQPLVAAQLSQPRGHHQVQKLLFSATLSQDPEKLTRLGLFQPRLFTSVVSSSASAAAPQSLDLLTNDSGRFVGKYTTPAELTEHSVLCSPSLKPLVVHHLLRKFDYRRVLCFAGSLSATHRLYMLLSQMGDFRVAECSSQVSRSDRDDLLKQFSAGKIDLMVCTDAVARGMDLGTVDCVISYDPPKFVKNYIHRIGRTARAGRPGTAITLLTDSETRRFEKLIEHAEKETVTTLQIADEELHVYEDAFRKSLETLKKTVKEEAEDKIVQSSHRRQQKVRGRPKFKSCRAKGGKKPPPGNNSRPRTFKPKTRK